MPIINRFLEFWPRISNLFSKSFLTIWYYIFTELYTCSIIITVTGKEDQAGISVGSSKVILNRGQILIEDEDNKVVRIYEGPFSDEMGFSPTVMTIRAKKSDVDAFSKGKLDFDKFRQKVQSFTYWLTIKNIAQT